VIRAVGCQLELGVALAGVAVAAGALDQSGTRLPGSFEFKDYFQRIVHLSARLGIDILKAKTAQVDSCEMDGSGKVVILTIFALITKECVAKCGGTERTVSTPTANNRASTPGTTASPSSTSVISSNALSLAVSNSGGVLLVRLPGVRVSATNVELVAYSESLATRQPAPHL
jgi:hypothetical protein